MSNQIEENFYSIDSFEEIRPFYEAYFPDHKIETIYKIRNWRERFHPEFLGGEIYFSRPIELNDPFDIHTPIQIDPSIVDDPAFLQRLVALAPAARGVNPGRDAQIIAEKQLEIIKQDAVGYFIDNYQNLVNSKRYNDSIGVLSMTTNPTNKQLWGYYAGGLKGFAVGFDPMGLTENLFSTGYLVDYNDEIPVYSIFNQSQKDQHDLLFRKTTEWTFESEFRYTRIINPEDQTRRIHHYPPEIVKEILLGPRIPDQDKDAILEVVKDRYPHARVFQMRIDYRNAILYKEEIKLK